MRINNTKVIIHVKELRRNKIDKFEKELKKVFSEVVKADGDPDGIDVFEAWAESSEDAIQKCRSININAYISASIFDQSGLLMRHISFNLNSY